MTELENLYEAMLRIRMFEDEVHRLFTRQEIPGTAHLYQGQEAVAVGVCSVLDPNDSVSATYRGHGAAVALGCDPSALLAELLGRESGICGGHAGSMKVIDHPKGLLGCFGIVGGSIAAATGAALAAALMEDDSVAVAFFGDGACNQAYFHKCLNFASVMRLPVVYVCENNLYGEWTPMVAVTGGGAIAPRAAGYGIPGQAVDGNDVIAVRDAAAAAVDRARAGDGPSLLECQTYRHEGDVRTPPEPEVIGGARIRQVGDDITIVAAMAAVHTALAAAEALKLDGIDCEVVDLRSLRPLGTETIAASVARTRRLVVVEDGPPLGGYAAEVIAPAIELAGPVPARRVCGADLPIPFAPELEDLTLPGADAVANQVRALLGEGPTAAHFPSSSTVPSADTQARV